MNCLDPGACPGLDPGFTGVTAETQFFHTFWEVREGVIFLVLLRGAAVSACPPARSFCGFVGASGGSPCIRG